MNAGSPTNQDPEPGATATGSAELSALERALRRALDSLTRDQVVRCIASVLPAAVLIEESSKLHGGKARKVSVSMPEELAEAVRTRTGAGGFSRYVTEAVQERRYFRTRLEFNPLS